MGSVTALPMNRFGDGPLEDRAMLARLRMRCPSFQKIDRKISREVAERKGSSAEMHHHSRKLLAKSALADIQKVIGAARAYHVDNTSPWQDEGQRILTGMMYDEYMAAMRKYEREFNEAVSQFVPNYPQYMEEAKKLLADAWNERDYPSPLRIAERFSFSIDIDRVNTSNDFRCNSLNPDEQERIRQEIESRTQEALQGVTRDLLEQMFGHVEHMVERLTAYEAREAKSEEERKEDGRLGVFRDSLVTNMREFVERLPKLNLTGDPKIEQLRQRCLRTLCTHEADDLRKSPLTRNHVLAQAKAIREAVSELI